MSATSLAMHVYGLALQTALVLSLPAVGVVAIVGVLVSLAQTVVGIQDQNISFGPKIITVAALVAIGGLPALALLTELLLSAIRTLPHLAG